MLYIIAAIIIAFILQLAIPGFTELFYISPAHPEQLWRLVTSIFLHGSFEHLFFNCLSLFFFVFALMRTVGRTETYKIFMIGGIVGNLFYLLLVFLGISAPLPALGASGAIYAILGAVALFQPESVVYLYFFPVKMKHAVALWVLINMGYIVDWSSGIGGAAHLGGLFFGYMYAKYLRDRQGYGWSFY